MSWGTCYSGSNNIHPNYPALMSDGKMFTLYNPACDLNKKLKQKNGMKNNYEYRQFLIKNGVSLMNQNNIASCNECSECVLQNTSNDKSYGKYLFTSVRDNSKPYGYQNSNLKNLYLERQSLNSQFVSPIVTQDELLRIQSGQ